MREILKDRLAGFEARQIADETLRDAAVALVVTPDAAGELGILMTRRPARMGRHAGQYALPGGKVDPGETPEIAALRELHEELGLHESADAILGRLDDYPTRSGFRIMPFVVWLGEARPITPAPDEVAAVYHIPFIELDSDAVPLFDPGETPDRPVLYSEFPSLGTRMAAPTAAIVYQFREVALRALPTRVAHYDQPRFAWR